MLLRKKEEIEAWLNQYNVKNYELIPNKEYGYVVNVKDSLSLSFKGLKSLDVKFNEVNGFFDCSDNELKSLENGPEIIKGEYYCNNNKLKIEGLKFFPKEINKNYIDIRNNEKLGDLQNIRNIKELKEKVKILLEKENLLKIINKDDLNLNKISNKI